jgi:hypothetical protein
MALRNVGILPHHCTTSCKIVDWTNITRNNYKIRLYNIMKRVDLYLPLACSRSADHSFLSVDEFCLHSMWFLVAQHTEIGRNA